MIDRKNWNYWYEKFFEKLIKVENFINLRKRTIFVLRKNFLTIHITIRKQFQIRSKYVMFEVLNKSIDQSIIIIDFSIINISVIAKLNIELFQIVCNNFVMFIFEQFESFQFIFDNFKTSVFENQISIIMFRSHNFALIFHESKKFEIVLKFHIHISRRFNSV